ncbi:MAG: SMI1/KNR4 family protein [Chloroflexota bacterium]|nr:SMI1/KNR4 family protein [Chloroflexota bacterium]
MYLDEVKARFSRRGVLRREKVVPCTEEEVRSLEDTLGFSLPATYREFLLWMGHARGAGNFLRGSDCFYEWLPLIQGWAVELLEENGNPEVLPEDAFVFYMHQGYRFYFLRLSEGDNPPIYYYTEVEQEYRVTNGQKVAVSGLRFELIHQTLADFLDEEISHYLEAQRSMKELHLQLPRWYVDFRRWLTDFRNARRGCA